jgi:hypothetical protein
MVKRLVLTGVLVFAGAFGTAPVRAIFVRAPAPRVTEVPVERILENLERNAQQLSPAEQARAVGRVHLLAYLKGAATLPVYRDQPGRVAEGDLDDCAAVDPDPPAAGGPRERCVRPSYSLDPPREVPQAGRVAAARPSDAHLQAAIAAYVDAKSLDPSNLRTRLALAFAYDRSGQQPLALDDLRFVADEGLRQLTPRQGTQFSDWELHVVLSEAQQHLASIATAPSDRQLADRLLARLTAAPPAIAITPILVPLQSHDSVQTLIDRRSPVAFDFSGQGFPIRAGWLTPNAGWLVWDPYRHAAVTSGFQLFGSVTWMMFWSNGYQALGVLDDDGDGRIAGEELEGLALWHDRNGNGVSDAGEVGPLATFGIVSLAYAHERASADFWVSRQGVTFRDGRSLPTYDWLLHARPAARPTQ